MGRHGEWGLILVDGTIIARAIVFACKFFMHTLLFLKRDLVDIDCGRTLINKKVMRDQMKIGKKVFRQINNSPHTQSNSCSYHFAFKKKTLEKVFEPNILFVILRYFTYRIHIHTHTRHRTEWNFNPNTFLVVLRWCTYRYQGRILSKMAETHSHYGIFPILVKEGPFSAVFHKALAKSTLFAPFLFVYVFFRTNLA